MDSLTINKFNSILSKDSPENQTILSEREFFKATSIKPRYASRAGQRRLRTENQADTIKLMSNLAEYSPQKNIADILIEYGNNPLKISAINYAAYLGKIDVVKLLLQYGANINQASSVGTPLEIALKGHYLELAALLIEHKATATVNAACICSENHFYKELEMLIKANPQELVKSERVIIACCESAFLDGLELLFSNGANIPEHFTHQKMLYKLLAKGNPIYVPIVKFMIRQGADCNYTHSETHRINNAHNHGWTADCSIGLIVPALDFDDEELIHLLIHNGAHIDSQIKVVDKNKTPFFSDNRQRVKILCLHPLYKALYNRKFDMANLLLASGSKREAWLDTEFNNAIFLESINQNMQNKDYFLGIKKADQMGFLKQDHYFSNMMRWAINQKNDVQWVKLLFEVGAQPKDSYLEWAIEKKNKEIIQLLIDNGAHP